MNILFLAFEDEAIPLARLARRFKDNGHKAFVASCDHFSVTHGRGRIAKFCQSQGLEVSEFTDLDSVFQELNSQPEDMTEDSVDWRYLREFDAKYGQRFTLMEAVAMDPVLSDAYHSRSFYYRPENKALLFKSVELHARWLERIFARHKFDAVFTLNNQYFVKATAYSMAKSLGIPFLMVASCRIRNTFLMYDNYAIGTPQFIVDEMHRLMANDGPCDDALAFIDDMKTRNVPAWTTQERWGAAFDETISLSRRLKEIWRTIRWARHAPRDRRYRGLLRRDYFLPSYGAMLINLLVALRRRVRFFRHKAFIRTDLPKHPFVFFPLHIIPESTVLTLSSTMDEMECLYQLSKVLPPDWKVVVKVNYSMLGSYDTHPHEYYLQMNKIPNVQFVDPRMMSPAIIAKSSAVACICGTALLEGAVLGKPGFRWGQPEYDAVDTIYEFRPDRFREQLSSAPSRNVKYYVQACFNLGLNIDYDFALLVRERLSTPEEESRYDRQLTALEDKLRGYLEAKIAA